MNPQFVQEKSKGIVMSVRPFHFLVLGFAIAVLLWVTVVYSQSGQAVSNSDTGRFQLFEGRYETPVAVKSGQAGGIEEVGVFKIDTRTGETWNYITLSMDGVYVEYWTPIPTNDPKKNEGE